MNNVNNVLFSPQAGVVDAAIMEGHWEPQGDEGLRTYWEETAYPTASSTTPKQIGAAMTRACGKQAGDYARTFWASRENAAKAAKPWPVVTTEMVERHRAKFGDAALPEPSAEVRKPAAPRILKGRKSRRKLETP